MIWKSAKVKMEHIQVGNKIQFLYRNTEVSKSC